MELVIRHSQGRTTVYYIPSRDWVKLKAVLPPYGDQAVTTRLGTIFGMYRYLKLSQSWALSVIIKLTRCK